MGIEHKEKTITPAALGALARGDLENFVVASAPGGIERQEAQGQQDFVASTTLPIRVLYCTDADFEALGFVFGEPVDDIFRQATLPVRWKKVASDHSMWSHIVDETSRKRVNVFYKAAFYDRNAFMSINRDEKE